MTYSYLATVPLLVVFSVAITTIKFKEGYMLLGDHDILATPVHAWSENHRRLLLPLFFVLSVAWSLEITTHLEELTFWLFLLHQGPKQRDWFHSLEFKTWCLGSLTALVGMPVTTIIARQNMDTCQAWIFLVGSLASTTTTMFFLYILFRFPGFIRHVKDEGALPDVVIRLVTFYQLNLVRVAFRFLFTVPLLVLAADGIREPHPINIQPFWSDFLLMMGGIGCFVSSGITLMIFFPRSITEEEGYRARDASPSSGKAPIPRSSSPLDEYDYAQRDDIPSPKSPYSYHSGQPDIPLSPYPEPGRKVKHRPSLSAEADDEEEDPSGESDDDDGSVATSGRVTPMVASPTSHAPSDDTMWDRQAGRSGKQHDTSVHHRRVRQPLPVAMPVLRSQNAGASSPQLHPYVMNFTSPIDLLDQTDEESGPRAV
ncbi:hypothetical protein ONZ45_g16704 [Pleurotus djamor]|nr:hypothetical protein ONZ45_g16704 [Pleurotus djamor]